MSPDDRRHGTPAGYMAHWRAGQKSCRPCLDAFVARKNERQRNRRQLEEDIALTDGRWVGRGGIQVWETA